MNLSVIIPVYNEVKTINQIINKILKVNVQYKEIIIVDDFSEDGTKAELEKFEKNSLFKIVYHNKNKGKGACLITALPLITAGYVIIQDADLEYEPKDFIKFMDLVKSNNDVKVIYGSRVLNRKKKSKNFIVNLIDSLFLPSSLYQSVIITPPP